MPGLLAPAMSVSAGHRWPAPVGGGSAAGRAQFVDRRQASPPPGRSPPPALTTHPPRSPAGCPPRSVGSVESRFVATHRAPPCTHAASARSSGHRGPSPGRRHRRDRYLCVPTWNRPHAGQPRHRGHPRRAPRLHAVGVARATTRQPAMSSRRPRPRPPDRVRAGGPRRRQGFEQRCSWRRARGVAGPTAPPRHGERRT